MNTFVLPKCITICYKTNLNVLSVVEIITRNFSVL